MSTTTTTTTAPISLAAKPAAPKQSVLNFTGSSNSTGPRTALHQIPTFSDPYAERQWAKEQMAAAFRIIAKFGWADGSSGHISLRDPVNPNTFWINPYAVHFGLIKASDMVLVNEEGEPLEPTEHRINTAGFIIHSSLHKARPDVNAACHVHSPYGRAWSSFGRGIEMLNQDSCYFYNDLAVYEGFGGVVLAREEGDHIAQALGPTKKSIILQNHGLLTTGGTIGECMAYFIALERACECQLLAEAAAANGIPKRLVGEKEAAYTKDGLKSAAIMYMQFKPEYDMVLKESGGDFLE